MAMSPQPSFPYLHHTSGYNPSPGRFDSASTSQTPTVSSCDSSNQQSNVSNPEDSVAIFAQTFQRTIASIANAVHCPDLDAPSTPSPATTSQDIVQMHDPRIIQTVRLNADLGSVPPEMTYPESISAEQRMFFNPGPPQIWHARPPLCHDPSISQIIRAGKGGMFFCPKCRRK